MRFLQESVPWVEKHPASRSTHGRAWIPRMPGWAAHLVDSTEAAFEAELDARREDDAKHSVLQLA